VFGIVGARNSGKTTLVEALVSRLSDAGLRIATIKGTHHDIDLDVTGKDSWRHRQAGAFEVVLVTPRRFVLFHERSDPGPPKLTELIARLAPADLVLVEGFKRADHPKLEVHRPKHGAALLAPGVPTVYAVATTAPIRGLTVPQLALDDIEQIAAFVRSHARPVPDWEQPTGHSAG